MRCPVVLLHSAETVGIRRSELGIFVQVRAFRAPRPSSFHPKCSSSGGAGNRGPTTGREGRAQKVGECHTEFVWSAMWSYKVPKCGYVEVFRSCM